MGARAGLAKGMKTDSMVPYGSTVPLTKYITRLIKGIAWDPIISSYGVRAISRCMGLVSSRFFTDLEFRKNCLLRVIRWFSLGGLAVIYARWIGGAYLLPRFRALISRHWRLRPS